MVSISQLTKDYYEMFKGLPSTRPIVRNNTEDDAFELTVLYILYGSELNLTFEKRQVEEIAKYIVSPPDSGIDIFIEKQSGDESYFDVIQVKNKPLKKSEVRTAILEMERTVDDFCIDAQRVSSDSCREMLSNSSLDKNSKTACHYYVVHTGKVDDFDGQKEHETVINLEQLQNLYDNGSDKVRNGQFFIDDRNNYMKYRRVSVSGDQTLDAGEDQNSIVCSINGYDLAQLNNKFYDTQLGRNILFGQNLRESLVSKKSKTYAGMAETIIKCPENFWYYNNGITIISEGMKPEAKNGGTQMNLTNFSIVNGAQTTSSLGFFLKEAIKNGKSDYIEQLKKVYVLTRILKVTDENMRRDIAIYNNTQNPITNDPAPTIYMEVRRGSKLPSTFNKKITHRKTTNEELAQIAYASFLLSPFTAKDKKSALFSNDFSQDTYTLNKVYHDIFNYDQTNSSNCGILFLKTKDEIDEALFSQQLYKEAKKIKKKYYQEQISSLESKKSGSLQSSEIQQIDLRIAQLSPVLETVGVCMFYCIATYYEFKAEFDSQTTKKLIDYDKYYNDNKFRLGLINQFADLILMETIKLLNQTAREAKKAGNINNWVRSAACQTKFFEALRNDLIYTPDLRTKYLSFVEQYKK